MSLLYRTFVLFGYMAAIPVPGLFNSRHLVFIIALYVLYKNPQKTKQVLGCFYKRILLGIALIGICSLMTFIHHCFLVRNPNNTYFEFYSYFWIILYVVVFAIYCSVEYHSILDFSKILIGIMIVESIIIFFSAINDTFRLFLYDNFNFGDDRFDKTIESGSRIIGLGISSATGALTMSTACMLLVILKINGLIKPLIFYACYLTIFVATAFIGRTGMFVEVAVLFPSLFKGNKVSNLLFLSVFVGTGFYAFSLIMSSLDPYISEYLVEWMTGAFDDDKRNSIMEGISKGGFPPFSYDSIWGTGLATGYIYNGNIYEPDSGYIRTWISIGLVGFIFYYLALFIILTSVKLKAVRPYLLWFIYYLLIIAFIVEYKEPFFMKCTLPWIIMTLSLLLSKSNGGNLKICETKLRKV